MPDEYLGGMEDLKTEPPPEGLFELQNCQRKPLPSREGMNLAPRERSAANTTCHKNRL